MRQSEQIQRFADEIDALVERYRAEYDIPYAAAIGVLHMVAFDLCREASEADEDDGGNDHDEHWGRGDEA